MNLTVLPHGVPTCVRHIKYVSIFIDTKTCLISDKNVHIYVYICIYIEIDILTHKEYIESTYSTSRYFQIYFVYL